MKGTLNILIKTKNPMLGNFAPLIIHKATKLTMYMYTTNHVLIYFKI